MIFHLLKFYLYHVSKEFSTMVTHYNKSKFDMPKSLLKRFDDLYHSMMLDKCKKHDYMKSRRKFKKLVSMVERKTLKEINHHEYKRRYKGYSVSHSLRIMEYFVIPNMQNKASQTS